MSKKDIRYFVVPGRPRAKQRPRLVQGGRVITPKETVEYERKLRDHYLKAHSDQPLLEGDVAVDLFAFYSNRIHPDLDNIIKILDGVNKVAWDDDKQVKEIHAYLLVNKDEEERLEVFIRRLNKNFVATAIKKLKKMLQSLVTKPRQGPDI